MKRHGHLLKSNRKYRWAKIRALLYMWHEKMPKVGQTGLIYFCKDKLVIRWKAAERCVEAENQLVLANINLDKVNVSELFKIGVDLNDMSSVPTMRMSFILVQI